MKKVDSALIDIYVDSFPHRFKEGFTLKEINIICEYFKIDFEQFNKELRGNTCVERDNQLVIYPCDVRTILYKLVLQYEDPYSWD